MDQALLTFAETVPIKGDANGIKLNAGEVAQLNARLGLSARHALMGEGKDTWVNPLTLGPLALLQGRDVTARLVRLQATLDSAVAEGGKKVDDLAATLNPQISGLAAAMSAQIAMTESLSRGLLALQEQHKVLAARVEDVVGAQSGLQGSATSQFDNISKFLNMFKDLTVQGPGTPGEVGQGWETVAAEAS